MTDFKPFKKAIDTQFQIMSKHQLFEVDMSNNPLWDLYLNSFPEGTNPVYKERTEYDCNCCKNFIRNIGNVVAIINGQITTIWDVDAQYPFDIIAEKLATAVKQAAIKDYFLHGEPTIGTNSNHTVVDGKSVTYDHYFIKLPNQFVCNKANIATKLSEKRSAKDVLARGLQELTVDSLETVLELIDQGSLYRGDEHKSAVTLFLKHKKAYDKLSDVSKSNYPWTVADQMGAVARIRNTAIGTLLIDLSENMELDKAVKRFETVVAPTNYKRPTALITKSMIANAQETVEQLGLTSALSRRYAVAEDLTINNVLFADRSVKPAMNVFDELVASVPANKQKFDKVEEISIEDFIKDVLPKATQIELLLANNLTNNLMSLIAPVDSDSQHLFKWNNNFSWAYNGDITDSIKERVKQAGGSVTGDLRCSLSWFNYDDLDLSLKEPGPRGTHIYYGNKRSVSGGRLDVDMNAGCGQSRSAVENITYANKGSMLPGKYQLVVNNFTKRETKDEGFEVEIEFCGTLYHFVYNKPMKHKENVTVAEFEYSHEKGLKIISSLPSSTKSKQLYGVPSENFHKVSMVMLSPNYWDDQTIGNKHWFFILEGCKNEGRARGFFNEFINPNLDKHRKVLEVLGSKMTTEESDKQLSGVGFSSTQRNQAVVKVSGKFTRTLKINF